MDETSQLDQSALQDLLGGGTAPSLIPESLITTLTVGFIVLNVLGILFMIFYIFSMVRKWRVETAMLKMQKDVAEIKAALSKLNQSPAAIDTTSQPPAEVPQPGQSSREIATAGDSTNPPAVS